MAVVNKVHIQAWIPLQLGPYIVTHNHPYMSSCKPVLLISTAATYVGMVICDNVGCRFCFHYALLTQSDVTDVHILPTCLCSRGHLDIS